jgi:hypothetical protein
MTKHLRLLAALALATTVVAAGAAHASKRIATETGKSCTTCHDKPGSKLLTDAGKYFESMHTLDGFTDIRGSFGKCTACHVRKPGSTRLTKKGKELAGQVKDMNELRQWVQQHHPQPAAK